MRHLYQKTVEGKIMSTSTQISEEKFSTELSAKETLNQTNFA